MHERASNFLPFELFYSNFSVKELVDTDFIGLSGLVKDAVAIDQSQYHAATAIFFSFYTAAPRNCTASP
jgi:hypothetical protein